MNGLRLDIPATGSCMHVFVLCLCTVLCYMFVYSFVLYVCALFCFICLCTVLFYMFVSVRGGSSETCDGAVTVRPQKFYHRYKVPNMFSIIVSLTVH